MEFEIIVALRGTARAACGGVPAEHIDAVGRRPWILRPPGDGLIESKAGPRVGMGRPVSPPGSEWNESALHRVLHHGRRLARRIGVGIDLRLISVDRDGLCGPEACDRI